MLRIETVELNQALGRLLTAPIFQNGSGKKLLAKGHLISEDDIRLLLTAGEQQVVVAQLEENDVPEEEAALAVASESACGSMEIHMAAGGRANLVTTQDCCLLVDDHLLREVNSSGCVTMATVPNLAFAGAGQRVATVKTAPFSVPRDACQAVVQMVKQNGPILQARPIHDPVIGVLYTDPRNADRSRTLFEGIMRTRLERLHTTTAFALSAIEEEATVARGLEYLLRARPTLILVASTTAPAGPDDVVGRALRRVGCQLERFLAPVEPGNLLLLCYAGDTPVVTAPGCFRSPKPNVVDLILPPPDGAIPRVDCRSFRTRPRRSAAIASTGARSPQVRPGSRFSYPKSRVLGEAGTILLPVPADRRPAQAPLAGRPTGDSACRL